MLLFQGSLAWHIDHAHTGDALDRHVSSLCKALRIGAHHVGRIVFKEAVADQWLDFKLVIEFGVGLQERRRLRPLARNLNCPRDGALDESFAG